MKPLTILIVDDHEMVRDGILSILQQENYIKTVYQAANGEECLSKCNTHSDIDIVLLDISMPDISGIETARFIKERHTHIDIIALSMLKDKSPIRKMLQAGASGYVSKESGTAELLQAIQNIGEGKTFYSEKVSLEIMEGFKGSSRQEKSPDALTDREIEILRLIVNEHTNKEIADKLYISKRTVDTHRTNLLQKTGSKNTAGLVKYAMSHNLIPENKH